MPAQVSWAPARGGQAWQLITMGGRAGSLRHPSLCLLPPSSSSFLAPLLQGQTEPRLISGGHQQTPQQLHEPRHQRPEARLGAAAAMSALGLLILGLLTAVPPASCQQGLGNLQPWMQGLIAVAVFLVLVAIAFAVNHFWCQEEPEPAHMILTIGNKADGVLVGTDGRYSSMAASFRSSEHENAYENVPEEEGKVRSTPM
ncbi:PDZK1-interacting protein 1 isoform X1 [Pongo pygmaeus]|uniref:PDZK1-interacting protein 1 isoform X1 n=2 Tax=Pongo pygmaeus TaxID=9600 RepID=UPI0023E1049C|nr:PDZK1-interacting protein 1 [Pongo pygmaeus]